MTAREWCEQNMSRFEERLDTKERAISPGAACACRADEDPQNMKPENCCLIGFAMTPEQWDEEINLRTVNTPLVMIALDINQFDEGGAMLADLQGIHDHPIRWDDRHAEFQKWKERWGFE